MPDKNELHEDPKPTDNKTDEQCQKEFEERYDLFLSQFQDQCIKEEVPAAIAIFIDPKTPQVPIVFQTENNLLLRGKLLAMLLRDIKKQIDKQLSIDLRADPQ
jgi:hypothetical protein